jgi:hypothetical protein
MNINRTDRILTIIAVLLFANVGLELYKTLVPSAHAGDSIDCNIVGISSSIYNKLPIKIAEIDSSLREIPVKVKGWDTNDDVEVKVVDWDTYDEVKVKVSN